jgi:hypothetical protein
MSLTRITSVQFGSLGGRFDQRVAAAAAAQESGLVLFRSTQKMASPDPARTPADASAAARPVGDEADFREAALEDGLTRRDRDILAFERQWWKYAGAKEQAIRELFDMSATRYYQVLNALIDTPQALAADPMLVKRLRRLRAARHRQRSARRLGIEV